MKKPVLEVAKQPKPLMEVQQQQQQQQQQLKRNHRAELETHLGSTVPYKIATMGSARRLAYMASVVVEGEQYKTYPQTFPSQVIQTIRFGWGVYLKFISDHLFSQAEAEEALAALVLDKRGVQTGQVAYHHHLYLHRYHLRRHLRHHLCHQQVGKPVEPGVTRDILQCAERVLQLLGSIPKFAVKRM